jgi:hypothetical protein
VTAFLREVVSCDEEKDGAVCVRLIVDRLDGAKAEKIFD